MNKFFIILILLILIIVKPSLGQSKWVERGDDYFKDFEFSNALKAYEKALEQSEDFFVYLKLSQVYDKLENPEGTENVLKKANKLKALSGKDQFKLAMALTQNKKYDEALYWFEVYGKNMPGDERAFNYIKQLTNIEALIADSGSYKIEPLKINTKKREFLAGLYFDDIIVSAEKKNQLLSKRVFKWDNSSYLDLYLYNPEKEKISSFSSKLNTPFHEGPVCFYEVFTKAFFTRNNYVSIAPGKSNENIVKLKLYHAQRRGGKWINVKEFEWNSDEYSVGHPAINDEGTKLYVVSDKPGGYGGTDIYFSQKLSQGWTDLVNMGKDINTKGNEMFPFLLGDSLLYFSSDGLGGLGGLDVYESSIEKDTSVIWKKNIGYPVNSSKDDFAYVVLGDQGYFSSNRNNGLGKDDIYKFYVQKKGVVIRGLVLDSVSSKPLEGVRVNIYQGKIEKDFLMTDATGQFKSTLDLNKPYKISYRKAQYITIKDSFDTMGMKEGGTKMIKTKMVPADLMVKANIFNKETKLPFDEPEKIGVSLLNETSGDSTSVRVDKDGELEMELEANSDYLLKAEKPDYFTLTKRFSTNGVNEPTSIDLDIPFQEIVVNKSVRIENIYYDFDRWEIRPDAAFELDKIVQLLQDNPNIEIELSSHTDSRGDDAYNMTLSQRRAVAAVRYIVSRGVNKKNIVARGYGETVLVNYCGNYINCTEEEHQENRRTEFKVIRK